MLACEHGLLYEYDLVAYDHLDGNNMAYTYWNEGLNTIRLLVCMACYANMIWQHRIIWMVITWLIRTGMRD